MAQAKKRKLAKKSNTSVEVVLELGEAFEVGANKEYDLDLDCSTYVGKSGQAGTRRRTME